MSNDAATATARTIITDTGATIARSLPSMTGRKIVDVRATDDQMLAIVEAVIAARDLTGMFIVTHADSENETYHVQIG